MTRQSSDQPSQGQPSAYRVEAPRASDAIGRALRGAFCGENGLPEDMAAMLRQLNRIDPSSSQQA